MVFQKGQKQPFNLIRFELRVRNDDDSLNYVATGFCNISDTRMLHTELF